MDNDRTNEARELTEAELDAVSGGETTAAAPKTTVHVSEIVVTKLQDCSSPLLFN
jgi:hypothetical protein